MTTVAPALPDDTVRLRSAMADQIRRRDTFRTAAVEEAFRKVPRHLFLPDIPLDEAYALRVVITKRGGDGGALSSASHPNMVAAMLEQLDVRPGQRILEIGTATGINAALLAELAGPDGAVTTIEIDPELAGRSRAALAGAGYGQVEVACGDGALGHPATAPFDRIIVTAGAWDIPGPWWDQLAPSGRLVVPLRLHPSDLTRAIAFDSAGPGRLASTSARMCGFVAMRGADDSVGTSVRLAGDVTLSVDPAEADQAALSQALGYPAHRAWTGICRDFDPAEHLDLWLATASPGFARIAGHPQPGQARLISPAPRWGGAAMHDGAGTLAYLTFRPASEGTDELGVTAHGPASQPLASHVTALLRRWERERPGQPAITALRAGTPEDQIPAGTWIRRPSTTLAVTW